VILDGWNRVGMKLHSSISFLYSISIRFLLLIVERSQLTGDILLLRLGGTDLDYSFWKREFFELFDLYLMG